MTSSTHHFKNGIIISVESLDIAGTKSKAISIRLQGEDEQMLTDVVCGEFEALCLAQSILSVLTAEKVQL